VRKILLVGLCISMMILMSSFVSATLDDANHYWSMDDDNVTGTTYYDLAGSINADCSGMDTYGGAGHFNQSVYGDGNDNHNCIITGAGTIDNTWTVSLWFNHQNVQHKVLWSCGLASDNSDRGSIWYGTGGTIWFEKDGEIAKGSSALAINTWNMVTVTSNGTKILIYVNDTLEDEGNLDWYCPTALYKTAIGSRSYGTGATIGYIDEVGIWDYEFTQSQVTELFTLTENPYSGTPAPPPGAIQPYLISPIDDVHSNNYFQNFTFNYTSNNGSVADTCQLWTNESGTFSLEENLTNEYGFCYQETANVSTACGGLTTGIYSHLILTDWCKISYEIDQFVRYDEEVKTKKCDVEVIVNEQVDCKLNGKIKVDNKIIEREFYFCGLDDEGIVCDNNRDTHGGLGDGNGDGIITAGEKYIRI